MTRILLIEEDDASNEVLSGILRRQGYKVEAFPNYKEASAFSAQCISHLALCNVPRLNIENIKFFDQMQKLPSPPSVVLMTTNRRLIPIQTVLDFKARAILIKPFGLDELLQAVQIGLNPPARQQN